MHVDMQLEGVDGHGHWHLTNNETRCKKTDTQGGIKKLLSDHGEFKQKDTKC